MSYNQIFAKKASGSIVVGGKTVALSAATKTSLWDRPDNVAATMKGALEKAVHENPKVLPAGIVEICTRFVYQHVLCLLLSGLTNQ